MTCELSAIEVHTHLLELRAERASIEGLAVDSAYVADLGPQVG